MVDEHLLNIDSKLGDPLKVDGQKWTIILLKRPVLFRKLGFVFQSLAILFTLDRLISV